MNSKRDQVLAEAELNEGRTGEAAVLEAKYDSPYTASVEDELERMKAEMAGEQ